MKSSSLTEQSWFVYVIRCKNGSLYTGITNDLERRFAMHSAGTGAKFLRGKGPLTLEFSTILPDKSSALKIEHKIKQLTRSQKEKIITGERAVPSVL